MNVNLALSNKISFYKKMTKSQRQTKKKLKNIWRYNYTICDNLMK